MPGWRFYGRSQELDRLREMLARRRWFFCKLSGRRRIGKTALVQQALPPDAQNVLYLQVPDSAPSGVVAAFRDALDVFRIDPGKLPALRDLRSMAQAVGALADQGHIVILDEFQYFCRKQLFEFTSHLQEVVDARSARAASVPGGLIVLGSLHTDMLALLEDRKAPLYSRTTDDISLDHLDVESLLELLNAHTTVTPERFLFLWTLFEGVPKFYRDCFEQGVLDAPRRELLTKVFFQSSSPLRYEADNWFLHELRGRYDVALKYLARHPGCSHGDLQHHVSSVSGETDEQVGGYLKLLNEKFGMIDKRLPILAKAKARKSRYYLSDNFLVAWLAALKPSVDAAHFRPPEQLVERADTILQDVEGHALERLVGKLYEERGRKGLPGFAITERIAGYWDGDQADIDLVALNEEEQVVRFGTIKRDPARLHGSFASLRKSIDVFLKNHTRLQTFRQERVAVAPELDAAARASIEQQGLIAQDLRDLWQGLEPEA
jgi:AAA+ ATPase superfamily predicted ATPase